VTAARDTGSTRPLLDKLGVKPGARVVLLGVDDPEFRRLLSERTNEIHTKPVSGADLVFFAASAAAELKPLADIKLHIKSNGAIWVVRPKGVPSGLTETGIIEAALKAGLVDNKVVNFSPTHSALRLVIPLRLR
jgi:Protein of unknown function (DUF3052)